MLLQYTVPACQSTARFNQWDDTNPWQLLLRWACIADRAHDVHYLWRWAELKAKSGMVDCWRADVRTQAHQKERIVCQITNTYWWNSGLSYSCSICNYARWTVNIHLLFLLTVQPLAGHRFNWSLDHVDCSLKKLKKLTALLQSFYRSRSEYFR